MKEIIERISKIDAMAYESEQIGKANLIEEKQKFENEMKQYRERTLEGAHNKANALYNQIIDSATNDLQMQEKKNHEISDRIIKCYGKVEKDVIKDILELFFKKVQEKNLA
ncbi:MAG TPA: hypothetical protein DDZ89_14025 [Clostridiales bacterium]|nr:hypothetical protein [Clostridiales bacterium]